MNIKLSILFLIIFSVITACGQEVCESTFVATGEKGDDALYDAILSDNLEQAEDALKKGANPDAVFVMEGRPILSSAVGNPAMVKLLVKYGADIENTGWGDQTPLHYALIYCYYEGAKVLIENGAKTTFLNSGVNPPLIQIIGRPYKPVNCQVLDAVNYLINLGADVNYQTHSGKTALMAAAAVDDSEVAKFLIDKGARVDLKDSKGRSATDIAREAKSETVLALLGEK